MTPQNPAPAPLPQLPEGVPVSAWQAVIDSLPEHQRPAAWRALARLSKSPQGEDGVFPQFLLLCVALSGFIRTTPDRMIEATQKASQLSPDIRLLRETASTQDQIVLRLESLLGTWKIWAWIALGCFAAGLLTGLGAASYFS
jgi:hypothetical protein